jgi:hypothetical protein
MKRDVKVLLVGLALWLLGAIAVPLAIAHQRDFDLPPTTADSIYHWVGICGLVLLAVGSLAVGGAALSFSGRFPAGKAAAASLLFLAPAGLYSWISYGREVHTYAWVFLLIPWSVSILSGHPLSVGRCFSRHI